MYTNTSKNRKNRTSLPFQYIVGYLAVSLHVHGMHNQEILCLGSQAI